MIYEINIYKPHNGKPPFEKWFSSLKDKKTKQIIQARIDRAVFGKLGDIKGQNILLLLVGGNKKTQRKDIEKSKLYLKDWKSYE